MIPWTDLSLPIHEISGKAWGIIGLGRIGRKVAAIAEAFGAKVRWASVSGTDRSEPWRRVPLEELLKSSDIVSIHSPIGDRSRNLIDASKIALMKNTAILVNVGRGGIVNEVDLADALVKGRIAGAGLDVLWPEPPERTNALFRVASASGLQPGRLILTPHIAWAAVEARERAIAETALNIQAFLKGQRRNRVD